MRFGRARRQELVPDPVIPVAVPAYWEDRLRRIGSKMDGTGVELEGVVVSVAGGDVWVSGFVFDHIRHTLGPQPVSFRVEGVGVDLPVSRGADGIWATRMRAAGWGLDRDSDSAREPCIVHLNPGFLVTARVKSDQGWTTASWTWGETGSAR